VTDRGDPSSDPPRGRLALPESRNLLSRRPPYERIPVLLPPGTAVVDANSGLEYASDQWGLRHQSVFSLCQRCEQAVGLIVSQDGGVKAVKSVAGRLHFWDGVLD
jgi:hypothetical protein